MSIKISAYLSGNCKSRWDRETDFRHFCQIRTLSTEQFSLLGIAVSLLTKVIDILFSLDFEEEDAFNTLLFVVPLACFAFFICAILRFWLAT